MHSLKYEISTNVDDCINHEADRTESVIWGKLLPKGGVMLPPGNALFQKPEVLVNVTAFLLL